MFLMGEIEMTRAVAMKQGARGNHFCIQQGVLAEQAQEIPFVPVSPVEHWCDGKAM